MSNKKSEKSESIRKNKGSYSISVVSEMFGVHQQTIRLYEKEGLISPSRSSGNTRKFTEEDVNQLEEVIYLTHKLGVNLAGVSIILRLKKRMKMMQEQVNIIFDDAKSKLDQESLLLKIDSKEKVGKLVEMKNKKEMSQQDAQAARELLMRQLESLDFDDDDESF